MKYIDADKLKKSIGNYMEDAHAALNPVDGDADYYKGKNDACKDTQEFITSIQQEQPEVDLEEEMQEKYYKYAIYESGSISGEGYQLEAQGHYECNLTRKEFKDIARHFYELGFKARKEE